MSETLAELRSLPTEELIRRHDAHAKHVVVATQHYQDEIARRDASEQLQTVIDQTRIMTTLNENVARHTQAMVEQGDATTKLNEKMLNQTGIMVKQTNRMLLLTVFIFVLTIANVVLVAYSIWRPTTTIPAPPAPSPAVSPTTTPKITGFITIGFRR